MISYLHWCLVQFYKAFFLPTLFRTETKDFGLRERFFYIDRLLPAIIFLGCLGNIIAGLCLTTIGQHYDWLASWIGMAVAVAVGVAVAVADAVVFAVAGGVGGGVAIAMVGSMTAAVIGGVAVAVVGGVAVAVVFAVAGGVAIGITVSVAVAVAVAMVFAVAGSVSGIVDSGVVGIISFISTYFRLFWYPIDVLLSALSFLFARLQPNKSFFWFKVCPVSWNEVIWLPLPFLGKFLIFLTRQDYQKGLDKITFVAGERSLQRRAAGNALEEIAITELSDCKSVQELSNLADKLTWGVNLPAEISPKLPLANIDSISRQTAQYLTASSNYTRKEAIGKAINEVENLRKTLVVGPRGSGKLLKAVDTWKSILQKEEDKILSYLEISAEIPNPFIFGNPVEKTETNRFVGRKDIVKKIEENLVRTEDTPTLFLYGARRMGKSSVLNQLPGLLGKDFIPVNIDLQSAAVLENLSGLLTGLSEAVVKTLRQRYIRVEALRREELSNSPYAVFEKWLDKVQNLLPQSSKILLALDEYERLEKAIKAGKIGIEILDKLRHISHHHRKLVLLLVGSNMFRDMDINWSDYFIAAKSIHISYLTPDEIKPLIVQPIPEFNLRYSDGAVEKIIESTNCQPFLAQAVCFELVNLLNRENRTEALPADIDRAIPLAVTSGDIYFGELWQKIGEVEKKILAYIANITEGVEITEMAKSLDLSIEQVKPALSYLSRTDVLKKIGEDRYQLYVPMVARWILTNEE